MLSRAAESMYWLARHLERIENTARIVSVTSEARLDWPDDAETSWEAVLDLTGALKDFRTWDLTCTDQSAAAFLLSDLRNPSSVLSLCALARENNRVLLELLPRESWEELNALHQVAARPNVATVQTRDEHLREIIRRAQAIAGLFLGALNDDDGYAFLRLGRAIERGDFAARVLLGTIKAVGDGAADPQRLRAADWVSVLRSMTAFQMYRRSVQAPVTGSRVIRFLTCSAVFPRALAYCAKEVEAALTRLPNSGSLAATAARLSRCLVAEDSNGIPEGRLTDLVADSQNALLELHDRIAATYFSPAPDQSSWTRQTQTQSQTTT